LTLVLKSFFVFVSFIKFCLIYDFFLAVFMALARIAMLLYDGSCAQCLEKD
jgi:hypothetical protein